MSSNFKFKIIHVYGNARVGEVSTAHGCFETPAFLPVATRGYIIGLSLEEVARIGYNCIMCNTYHLWGQKIEEAGGLHSYIGWNGVIATDSGGFQIFSLGSGSEHGIGRTSNIFSTGTKRGANYVKINDDCVEFNDPNYGRRCLTPELSIGLQELFGSDIMFALDECTSPNDDLSYVEWSLERTHEWAKRCVGAKQSNNALFGIVQGGIYEELRVKSAKYISSLPFDGYGIGGSFGGSKEDMNSILGWVIPYLPEEKPRHLLGIGWVVDIFNAVRLGIDMFDCVEPTRLARHGSLYIGPRAGGRPLNNFRLDIRKARNSEDIPIDPDCNCYTCKNYTRKQLRELYMVEDSNYLQLAVTHNLHFMYTLMQEIRYSIRNNLLDELERKWLGA
ncbi:MAG: tRNA guanosine(34) transglycosylase Tgt [Candidatus Aenigmarchaeota archaeon]|nr:tRNA guanosine(34) transglycosylase Tgt [Candidatus Aenigmarchaeota archaeon]